MILDNISNCQTYSCLHPLFERGFEFIKAFDINNYQEGKNEIIGEEVYAIVSTLRDFENNTKLEVHNKYIDIQYVVKGCDLKGWRNRQDCVLPENDFDPINDYQLLIAEPLLKFEVNEGHFTIFYPNDAHSPLMKNNNLLKIVIKIKIN